MLRCRKFGIIFGMKIKFIANIKGVYLGYVFGPDTVVTIGREFGNTIAPINVDGFSRQHAKIYFKENAWWVEDLGSTNGTYRNRVKIEAPSKIEANDSIRFGMMELGSFEFIAEETAAPAPAPVAAAEPPKPAPVSPIAESAPVKPLEPVKPAETAKPLEPVKPAEPIKPLEPVAPLEPITTLEPVTPLEPLEELPVEPLAPAKTSPLSRPASLPKRPSLPGGGVKRPAIPGLGSGLKPGLKLPSNGGLRPGLKLPGK